MPDTLFSCLSAVVNDVPQESGSHTFSEERLSPEDSEAPHNSWSDSAKTQADKRQVSLACPFLTSTV